MRYNDYIALICYLDHARSIRLGAPESNIGTRDAMSQRFRFHSLRLRNDLSQICSENSTDDFAQHLFRPLSYTSFGFSDDIGIVCLDRVASAIRLTAFNDAVEQTDIVACPVLSSIEGIDTSDCSEIKKQATFSFAANEHWPFFELHELLKDDLWTAIAANEERKLQDDPTCSYSLDLGHPKILHDTPLCVVSNLKIATASLLLGESTLNEKLASAIITTVKLILNGLLRAQNDPDTSKLISTQEIKSYKCLLLESMGTEDYVLVSFCSNYSIPMAIVSGLRNLDFQRVFELTNPQAREKWEQSLYRKAIFRGLSECDEKIDKERIIDSNWMQKNHVFTSTYTTLCASFPALYGAQKAKIKSTVGGYVQANIGFEIKPGHGQDIDECISSNVDSLRKEFQSDLGPATTNLENPPAPFFFLRPGQHSRVVNLAEVVGSAAVSFSSEKLASAGLVPTTVALSFLKKLYTTNKPVRARDSIRFETGFIDMSSTLVAPVPNVEVPFAGRLRNPVSEEHVDCSVVYREIKRALTQTFVPKEGIELREMLRAIGCPSPLQASILYLFKEFLVCVEDPLFLSEVLDLYQPLTVLHRWIITTHASHQQYKGHTLDDMLNRHSHRAETFGRREFEQCVDSLQNAFQLRISRSVPLHETRDTAFFFRGGVSKFISGADVVAKACLHLLTADQKSDVRCRPSATVACRFRPQTNMVAIGLAPGNDSHAIFAAFNVDIFHMLQPEKAVKFVHEFGHLYFEQYIWESVRKKIESYFETQQVSWFHTELAEVFSELVLHILVFGDNCHEFSVFSAISYSEVVDSAMQDNSPRRVDDDIARLSSVLLARIWRAFLARYIVGRYEHATGFPKGWHLNDSEELDEDIVYEQFREFLSSYGRFFALYAALSAEVDANAYTFVRNNCRVLSIIGLEPILAEPALQIVRNHFRRANWSKTRHNCLEGLVAEKIGAGQPLALGDINQILGADAGIVPVMDKVLLLVCQISRKLISDSYGKVDVEKSVFDVFSCGGTVSENGGSDYFIDPTRGGLYCKNIQERASRLRREIAAIKSYWEFASAVRARTLGDLSEVISHD